MNASGWWYLITAGLLGAGWQWAKKRSVGAAAAAGLFAGLMAATKETAVILFGAAAPSGKLPMSWPKTMQQIPINQGDASYDPLYPFGHGLSY